MPSVLPRRPLAVALLLALLPLLPILSGCDSGSGTGAETDVTVMTRNLYLGGDLFTLLAPSCAPTEGNPIAAAICVNDLYLNGVVASDPYARMGAIAAEIEANDPDLVGLQEVSWYRRQSPSDFDPTDTTATPNASVTTFDFLQILQDSLAARGLNYVVAAQNDNADVELPATGNGGASFYDIRLTDRDVILARAGLDTEVVAEGNYPASVEVSVGGVSVSFTRGYSAVGVTKDGVDFTFANTHLEVGGEAAPVQRIQAGFFVDAHGIGDRSPLIAVGDFNANPAAEPDPNLPDAYDILVGAFSDAWTALRSSDPGYTCCQAADLRNDVPSLSERIDLVLYQGSVTPATIGLVGAEPSERTANGLWPSDHAGVVASFVVSN